MIDSSEISVVFQGAVSQYTQECINSARRVFPQAEIILSTWKDTKDKVENCDYIVYNKDPGAEIFTTYGKRQNQNRQIVSSRNGIKKASRKYVLKLRSDIKITGRKFLDWFDRYPMVSNKYNFTKRKILINSVYTRKNFLNGIPMLFHPSDWAMFGLREDLLDVWDIPLAPEPETSQYFLKHKEIPCFFDCLTRYHAEQYIWYSFLKKHDKNIDFDMCTSYTPQLAEISEQSLVNNMLVLDYKDQFDICNMKYPCKCGDGSEIMKHIDWLALYKKYCDPNCVFPLKYRWKSDLHIKGYLKHLYEHWQNVKKPIKVFFHWFDNILDILYYLIKLVLNVVYYGTIMAVKAVYNTIVNLGGG